jgi:hypothetical protein
LNIFANAPVHCRGRNDDTLTCGKTVGLDDYRQAEGFEPGERGGFVGKAAVSRRGDVGDRTQVLGESLRTLQLCCRLRRSKHSNACRAQTVSNTIDQRGFRADDHEVDGGALTKTDDLGMIGQIQRDQLGMIANSRVAGTGEQFCQTR